MSPRQDILPGGALPGVEPIQQIRAAGEGLRESRWKPNNKSFK